MPDAPAGGAVTVNLLREIVAAFNSRDLPKSRPISRTMRHSSWRADQNPSATPCAVRPANNKDRYWKIVTHEI
jgi:hypothetical protein